MNEKTHEFDTDASDPAEIMQAISRAVGLREEMQKRWADLRHERRSVSERIEEIDNMVEVSEAHEAERHRAQDKRRHISNDMLKADHTLIELDATIRQLEIALAMHRSGR